LRHGCRRARTAAAYFFAIVTARRFRPLARRRFKTARPARVFIRLRNPWVRFRLLLCGWYVRFTTYVSAERTHIDTGWHSVCQGRSRGSLAIGSKSRALYVPSITKLTGRYPVNSTTDLANPPPARLCVLNVSLSRLVCGFALSSLFHFGFHL
jgi:hypothetical protein